MTELRRIGQRRILVGVAALAALVIIAILWPRDVVWDGENRIASDTTVAGDVKVAPGARVVLQNGAKLTVRGKLEVSGILTCESGGLFVEVGGALVVNGSLACDQGDRAVPGSGISIVAAGDVTFSRDAQVETTGSVQLVGSEDQLKRSAADVQALFDEIARDTGDGVRIGPFLPEKRGSAVRSGLASLGHSGVNAAGGIAQQGQAGTMRLSGRWKVAGPFTWIQPSNVRNVELGDLSMTQPSGPDGESVRLRCPVAQAGDGGHAGRLYIRARETLRVYAETKLALGSGGAGGDAVAMGFGCWPLARAIAGHGGDSGNLKLQAGGAIRIEAKLLIAPGAGGRGGRADAVGNPGPKPGDGGAQAVAWAGWGGNSAGLLQLKGGAVGVERIEVGSVVSGAGGDGSARAGDGASGADCATSPNGGPGGEAFAEAGSGGYGMFLAPGGAMPTPDPRAARPTLPATLDPRQPPLPRRAEGAAAIAGRGGIVLASFGGAGGAGADCGAKRPGGVGGDGGDAGAEAGEGGSVFLTARGVGQAVRGADGWVNALAGGNGGEGGDGCPGGKGGIGGRPGGANGAPGRDLDVPPCGVPPPTARLTFEPTGPSVRGEVYLDVLANGGAAVSATLTGPLVSSAPTLTGTTDAAGKLRLTWVVTQPGSYRVSGTVGGSPISAAVDVTPPPATQTPTRTPAVTPTPRAEVELTWDHLAPGSWAQSELYFTVRGAPGVRVIVTVSGPGVIGFATQSGTTGTTGVARFAWPIRQAGMYRATGTMGEVPVTAETAVTDPVAVTTPTPAPTPTPTAKLTFEHTQPGRQSEVYLTVKGAPRAAVSATLTGAAVTSAATQSGTTDGAGELRLTWVITQFGTYRATGTLGSAPISAEVQVR